MKEWKIGDYMRITDIHKYHMMIYTTLSNTVDAFYCFDGT